MKTLNVLTLAMLVGVGSSAVANYNDMNKGEHTHHSHRHMRHQDKKDGKMKTNKKMKKESKSSKMKEDGKNTRRRHMMKKSDSRMS